MEVLHVDVLVGGRLPLAPQQQALLGRGLCNGAGSARRTPAAPRAPRGPALTFHRDVLDGEAQDDGPDHAQRHLRVAVHDFWEPGGKKATPSAPRRAARLDPTAQLMPRARGSGPCRGWAGSSGSPHAAPKSLPPCASDASSRRQGSRRGALAEPELAGPGTAAPAGTRSAAGHRRLQSREPRCAAALLRLARQGQPLPNGAEQRRAPAGGAAKSHPEPRGRPQALPAAS